MINVSQALVAVLEHATLAPIEWVALENARGRILRQNICADRPFPPYDRVTMDGIACRYEAIAAGQLSFELAGVQAAGRPPLILEKSAQAIEVMTGAVLPENADTVIKYEALEIKEGYAFLTEQAVTYGQNIHRYGSDRAAGDILVPEGRVLGATEIMTAATVGLTHLAVSVLPKIAIVSTGDELVAVADTPTAYQIRRSNVYAIGALLADYGVSAAFFHLPDIEVQMYDGLKKILTDHDVVVLTGAVSEGKFDFIPRVLTSLAVKKIFHKVAQRPGKPFWFGVHGAEKPIFALPGNPVSAFMCTCQYIVPWLRQYLGQRESIRETAVLAESLIFKPSLTYFVPVRTAYTEGVLRAWPLIGQGSGDLANLNEADAFAVLPPETDVFEMGCCVALLRFRSVAHTPSV